MRRSRPEQATGVRERRPPTGGDRRNHGGANKIGRGERASPARVHSADASERSALYRPLPAGLAHKSYYVVLMDFNIRHPNAA